MADLGCHEAFGIVGVEKDVVNEIYKASLLSFTSAIYGSLSKTIRTQQQDFNS